MANFTHHYLEDVNFTDLKEKTIIPLDLKSLNACEEKKLVHYLPEIFSDQASYNKIFKSVSSSLNELCYDKRLFPDCEQTVNPLFVPLYQWVCFLGNISLKLYELDFLFRHESSQDLALLEANEYSPNYLPMVRYGDVIDPSSVNAIVYNDSHLSEFVPRKLRLLYCASRFFSKFKSAFGKPKIYLLHGGFDRALLGCLIKKGYFPDIHVSRPLKIDSNSVIDKSQFDYIVSYVADRLPSEVAPHVFKQKCSLLYSSFKQLLDYPLRYFESLKKNNVCCTKNGPSFLICNATVKPIPRAIMYGYYTCNTPLHLLEFQDGTGTGLINNTVVAYRSFPIASQIYFNGPVSRNIAEVAEDMGNVGATKKLVQVGASQLNNSFRPRGPLEKQNRTIHYIPTAFSGVLRLGTNREYNDVVYWTIQKRILSLLVEMGCRVVYKAHPKPIFQDHTPSQLSWLKKQGIILEYRRLSELWPEIDFIVSDYLGSGILEAIAREKSTVLVELGARQVFVEAEKYLKQVVRYIKPFDINENWEREIRQALIDPLVVPSSARDNFFNYICGMKTDDIEGNVLSNIFNKTCKVIP